MLLSTAFYGNHTKLFMNLYRMKVITFLCCCFVSFSSFAQSPKSIESDLYKSFQKIDDWKAHQNESSAAGNGSLEKANADFAQKLKKYTSLYPFTITQKFTSLTAAHLAIAGSSDGLFRIYSWDTGLGGTMHDFDNVFQYKVNNKPLSGYNPADSAEEGHPTFSFSNIYTFKANDKTYYLAVYNGIFSSKDVGQGIRVFAIENGKLNDNVKLIKTKTGFRSNLFYDYDFFSVVDWKVRPSIFFYDASKTILVPLVDSTRQMTHKYIAYKFGGRYFERVKN